MRLSKFHAILFLAFSGLCATAQEVPRVYESKTSGDEAFRAGEYAVAASFYSKYRAEALLSGDSELIRDGMERELDALVRARLSDQAERLLNEYVKRYPTRTIAALVWRADIFLLGGKASDAERLLVRALAELPEGDPMRNGVRSHLGLAREQKGDYKGASEVYSDIYESSGDSPVGKRAFERLLLCLGACGESEHGLELLGGVSLPTSERDAAAYKLLKLYLDLKLDPAGTSFDESWKTLTLPSDMVSDSFFHTVFSLIGDELASKGKKESALSVYRAAYDTSSDKAEGLETLNRMVTILEQLDLRKEAALLALKEFDLFKGGLSTSALKMRIGSVLCSGGMTEKALEVYLSALGSLSITESEREDIYRNAVAALVSSNGFVEAKKLHAFNFKDTSTEAALFSMGSILESEGHHLDAAKLFSSAASKSGKLSEESYSHAAHDYFSGKDYDGVIKTAGLALDRNPESLLVLLRANAHEIKGDNALARQDYLHYAALDGASESMKAQAFFRTALLFLKDSRVEDAIRYFKRTFDEFPDSEYAPPSGCHLVNTDYNISRPAEAEQIIKEMKKRYSDSEYTGLAMLALADHYMNGSLDIKAGLALDEIEKSSMPRSIKSGALYRSALIAYRRKDYTISSELVQKLKTLYNDEPIATESFYLSGDIQKSLGKYEDAHADYAEVLKRRPDSTVALAASGASGDCHFALGTTNDDAKEYAFALEDYARILSSKDAPSEYIALARYKSGRTHQFMSNYKEAGDFYKKLVFCVPASRMKERPLELFWIQKAVIALEQMALKDPVPERIKDAETAIRRLADGGIITHDSARDRTRALKKKKNQTLQQHVESSK